MSLVLLRNFVFKLNVEGSTKHVNHQLVMFECVSRLKIVEHQTCLVKQLILQAVSVQEQLKLVRILHGLLLE